LRQSFKTKLKQLWFPAAFRLPEPEFTKEQLDLLEELIQLIQPTLSRMESETKDERLNMAHFLVDLGTGIWRIRRKIEGLSRMPKEIKDAMYSLESTWASMSEGGVEIIDHIGSIPSKTEAKVVEVREISNLPREQVVDTIKPTITLHGEVIQLGEVVIGRPAKAGSAVREAEPELEAKASGEDALVEEEAQDIAQEAEGIAAEPQPEAEEEIVSGPEELDVASASGEEVEPDIAGEAESAIEEPQPAIGGADTEEGESDVSSALEEEAEPDLPQFPETAPTEGDEDATEESTAADEIEEIPDASGADEIPGASGADEIEENPDASVTEEIPGASGADEIEEIPDASGAAEGEQMFQGSSKAEMIVAEPEQAGAAAERGTDELVGGVADAPAASEEPEELSEPSEAVSRAEEEPKKKRERKPRARAQTAANTDKTSKPKRIGRTKKSTVETTEVDDAG
jgi:hypothetical protein